MPTSLTRGRTRGIILVVLLFASGCAARPGDSAVPSRPSAVSPAHIAPRPVVTAPDLSDTSAVTTPTPHHVAGSVSDSSISPSTPAPSSSAGIRPSHSTATSSSGTPTTTTTTTNPPPAVTSAVAGGKVVALTFDDGPGVDTKHVLDILDAQKIPATFCQIGRQVADFPTTEQRLGASGYGLCDHTWDHDETLRSRTAAIIASEIDKTQSAITSATGVTPRYFRAPGGNWGTPGNLLRRELGDRQLAALGWDVDSEDWRKPGVSKIVANVMNEVQPGAIILMHDAGGDRSQTVAALPIIIAKLHAAGYRFVALP